MARFMSARELEDVVVYGDSTRVMRGERLQDPMIGSNVVRALLRQGYVETDERVERILLELGIESSTVRAFMQRREVTLLPQHLGGGMEARPVIPGLNDDSLSNYSGTDFNVEADRMFGQVEPVDVAPHKYRLNNLFRDVTLTDKLQISARRLQSAKRLAVSDPAAAAAMVTEYIREHGFPNSVVTAGDYAKTVGNAVAFIREMGRTIVYQDSAAPAVVSHGHIEVSFDQFHLKDIIWTVRGPLKYATEVNVVYQLAIEYGPEYVLFLLGAETIRLGIDIRNEKTGDFYTGAMSGYSSLSGIEPEGHGFPSELTADQQARLLLAGKKISPIYVGDAVIGSAVHVSDKHAILNEHTLTAAAQGDAEPVLCGEVISESMSVSGDVCVVRRARGPAQWLFREPSVGERVVLCYSVGENVEYSEVLQVLGCADQLILSGSNILRKGASGAAVIALKDSALLGIFTTMRASKVICSLFTSSSFAVVSDCQSTTSHSQSVGTPGIDAGDHTYAKMVKRGFLSFLERIAQSTASLYVQAHGRRQVAGLVANVAGVWHTTVNPDAAQLTMADGRMLGFETSSLGTYSVVEPLPMLQALPNVRLVDPGERVFVFTKVDSDVIMSSVRMVTHCLADNKGFIVEDFGESNEEMMGGLIIAERDSAVLGMYADRDYDVFGSFRVRCVPLVRSVTNVAPVGAVVPAAASLQSAASEFATRVLPVQVTFHEYVAFGRTVWEVAVGRRLHLAGAPISRASAIAADVWGSKVKRVMECFGSMNVDAVSMERYGTEQVGFGCLAAAFLRDSNAVMDTLLAMLDDAVTEATPVAGGFPFPHSASVVVSAPASTRTSVHGIEGARLQELEQRMVRLTEIVTTRGGRFSGVYSEVG